MSLDALSMQHLSFEQRVNSLSLQSKSVLHLQLYPFMHSTCLMDFYFSFACVFSLFYSAFHFTLYHWMTLSSSSLSLVSLLSLSLYLSLSLIPRFLFDLAVARNSMQAFAFPFSFYTIFFFKFKSCTSGLFGWYCKLI